eukprot:CAMPEP_0175879516 /NCGR_PEP_ID=MMETSP0107_2-20121207/41805_1 /TAXON_ID=195067 ORGANISM="Goniomonas pacifica, Strain CCMP1869" /NCGR_SAMPLE_ID=MMETSP0107_2 /ASSEMBLY_ACC=CAM_ASM_000203 /LENGTH=87 /DNA_ID=CAMNT_0017199157 /DNA_START=209 /DNA_END=469 /DNA_ORIENTATION=-
MHPTVTPCATTRVRIAFWLCAALPFKKEKKPAGVRAGRGNTHTRAKHNASCRASRRDEEVGDVVFRPVFDGVHGLFGWCAEALCGSS